MNQTLRLAAWLEANAKHMKFQDEHVQMIRAARELRNLDREISSNLQALQGAHEILAEMKKMLLEVADGKLSEQEIIRSGQRLSMPVVRRKERDSSSSPLQSTS
jgi:hypothetical protein